MPNKDVRLWSRDAATPSSVTSSLGDVPSLIITEGGNNMTRVDTAGHNSNLFIDYQCETLQPLERRNNFK